MNVASAAERMHLDLFRFTLTQTSQTVAHISAITRGASAITLAPLPTDTLL